MRESNRARYWLRMRAKIFARIRSQYLALFDALIDYLRA